MLLSLFSLRFQRIATSLRITTNMDNQESTSPTLNGGGHLPEGLFPHVLLRLRELKDDRAAKSVLIEKQQESLNALLTEYNALLTEHVALQTRRGALLTEHNALLTEHNALLTRHGALLTERNALRTRLTPITHQLRQFWNGHCCNWIGLKDEI